MADEKDLGHLLKLLDDDNAAIREKIWKVLASHLPAWQEPIRRRLDGLPAGTRKRLQDLLSEKSSAGFRSEWARWRELPDETRKLEAALAHLSAYLSGTSWMQGEASPLSALLDGLASEFRAEPREISATRLAHFLFVEKGLRGADSEYYDPRNSDLVEVIRTGRGIPISLACVFILVGKRLDLSIQGCDVPEHFLTRARENGEDVIIDCFDAGKVLGPDRLGQLEKKYAPDFSRLLRATATAEAIVARVLRNLINAYHLAGDKRASDFMWSLAEDMRGGRIDPIAPEAA